MTETITTDKQLPRKLQRIAASGTEQEARDWLQVAAKRIHRLAYRYCWTTQAEDLPSPGVDVFVKLPGIGFDVGFLAIEDHGGLYWELRGNHGQQPTHWMHIPELPHEPQVET